MTNFSGELFQTVKNMPFGRMAKTLLPGRARPYASNQAAIDRTQPCPHPLNARLRLIRYSPSQPTGDSFRDIHRETCSCLRIKRKPKYWQPNRRSAAVRPPFVRSRCTTAARKPERLSRPPQKAADGFFACRHIVALWVRLDVCCLPPFSTFDIQTSQHLPHTRSSLSLGSALRCATRSTFLDGLKAGAPSACAALPVYWLRALAGLHQLVGLFSTDATI